MYKLVTEIRNKNDQSLQMMLDLLVAVISAKVIAESIAISEEFKNITSLADP